MTTTRTGLAFWMVLLCASLVPWSTAPAGADAVASRHGDDDEGKKHKSKHGEGGNGGADGEDEPAHDTPCGDCSDGIACTADRCVDGRCEHVARDDRCDGGDCVSAVCRPADATADYRGCVVTPVREGEPCTDDGLACTDDVCTGRACLHVPIDARCDLAGTCLETVCAPGRDDADDGGCVIGAARNEGEACADDGDVCTDDRCQGGRCLHEDLPARGACVALSDALRMALGLRTLASYLALAGGGAAGSGPALVARLTPVEAGLDGAARALQGRHPSGALGVLVTSADASPMLDPRARIAFTQVLHTPRAVRDFMSLVQLARVRAELGPAKVQRLRGGGRRLLRGTKALKRDLQQLAAAR